MADTIAPEYIFETSWEVCNMVGGIYTVLSTRAATLQKEYSDKLIFIGPDVWSANESPYFKEDKSLLLDWAKFTLAEYQLKNTNWSMVDTGKSNRCIGRLYAIDAS